MKKYRRFFTAGLPWLIILLAMTQVTNAALITPDANGDVVNSSGASYTVNLGAGSSIDGGLFRDGISATFQSATTAAVLIIDLDASNGAGAIYGINPDLGVTLTNSGLIEGNNIVFADGTYDDTLNLNHGSRLIGSVNGGTGTNIINFGEGLSAPGGTGNSISGNVLGFHSINKDLGGVAFIGLPVDLKNSVLTDAININSGGLYINGFINGVNGVSPSLITTNGAALGGTGLWYAAVNVNAGGISVGSTPINLAVTPTDSVGALTITGNVTHTPGSFIGFDMIPQNGGNDLITTVGTYAVNGTNVHIATTDNNRAISNGT